MKKDKKIANELREKAQAFLHSEIGENNEQDSFFRAKEIIQGLLSLQSAMETETTNLLEELNQSIRERELYKDVFNSQPAGSYRIRVFAVEQWKGKSWSTSQNPPYTFEFASNRFAEILNIQLSDFNYNKFVISDLICREDKDSFVMANHVANIEFIPFRWEGRILIDENIKWIRLESTPQKMPNGDTLWTGILYDISERKKAEHELKKTQVQLEDVLNGASVGTVEWNIQNRTIKFNELWAKNLGYLSAELELLSEIFESNGWEALIHPDDLIYGYEILHKHFSGELPIHLIEVRMRHKMGHWVWMRLVGKVKVWTEDGRPLLMYGIHTNIDDRKKSEIELSQLNDELERRVQKRTNELEMLNSALQQSEQKFKTISDFTTDWEYWISPENKMIFISSSVFRITGYSISEFENDPGLLDEIVYYNDREIWDNHKIKRTADTKEGDSMDLMFRIVTKNGNIRWIGHVCRSIYVDGEYLGGRVSNRDITDKINAEKELLAVTVTVEERERNRFSSELHDGMGPLLSTIKLYFEWLSENNDERKKMLITEKGNQCIESAIQTARELSKGLSSQFLSKSGYIIAINDFITRINDTGRIHVKFVTNTTNRFNMFLEIALYRISTELLKNTLTYANASLVEVIFTYDNRNGKINFDYTDNGIGFDYAAVIENNVGLGLMNIQHRVQILKGSIHFESAPNKGMNVKMQFPVEELF